MTKPRKFSRGYKGGRRSSDLNSRAPRGEERRRYLDGWAYMEKATGFGRKPGEQKEHANGH